MKSDEEVLERVLAALGEAEAPEDMERRILGGLEAHMEARPASRWGWIVARRPLVWGLGLAGVIAGAWIAAGVHESRRNTTTLAGQPRSAAMPGVAGSSEAPVSDRAVLLGQTGPASVELKGFERKEMPPRESEADSIAMSEMRATSFPAPPMPLTEQERLLIRIAHQSDPEELAMLEPEIRMAREAQEKLEVQQFFWSSCDFGRRGHHLQETIRNEIQYEEHTHGFWTALAVVLFAGSSWAQTASVR